jgi:undecaprenyl phosphate-alpha-L-ara4N flippase subunit ArnE
LDPCNCGILRSIELAVDGDRVNLNVDTAIAERLTLSAVFARRIMSDSIRATRTSTAARLSMNLDLMILFAASIACDVFGQTFFKLGAMGIARDTSRSLMPILWVVGGLLVYVIEIFVWLRVLAIAPLTLAAPIASLNYIGVVLSGRWLFHEHMTARQWVGSGLVTLGVIAVALTGG